MLLAGAALLAFCRGGHRGTAPGVESARSRSARPEANLSAEVALPPIAEPLAAKVRGVVRTHADLAVVAPIEAPAGVVELVPATVARPLPRDPQIEEEPREFPAHCRSPTVSRAGHHHSMCRRCRAVSSLRG